MIKRKFPIESCVLNFVTLNVGYFFLRLNRKAAIPFVLILLGWNPGTARAVGPFEEYQGLVAGQGPVGNQDGAFNRALFNKPMGLALSSDNSTLYVADQSNNLIRTISLEENNKVQTLAGTGKAGKTDGPVSQASFDRPSALAMLPDDRLAVLDQNNSLIRVLDLKSKTVSVLAGNGTAGGQDGPALVASLSDVWNMAYYPPDHCLYFSQPDQGLLRRVSLDDGKMETVLSHDSRVPQPAALCVVGDNLYVANAGVTGTVLCLKLNPSTTPNASATPNPSTAKDTKLSDSFTITNVGQGRFITALAGGQDYLYGIQAGGDVLLQEFLPTATAGPVSLKAWWGEDYSKDNRQCLLFDGSNSQVGFVADPLSKRRFYFSNPTGNFIASMRDLNQGQLAQGDGFNSSGLSELEYPLQKPPHTYRILVVGRSYVYFVYNQATKTYSPNRAENLSKRMELFLNLSASLEDQPLRFEVLNCGKVMGQSLYLWSMYIVPDLVKKYDIDLVMILMDPGTYLTDYFERPTKAQGIPTFEFDSEYALKPFSERVPPGTPKKFYDLCLKYKLLDFKPDHTVYYHSLAEMNEHPDVRDCLVDMIGKPLGVLNQKLKAISLASGNTPRMEICYFPGLLFNPEWCSQADFWSQLAQKWGLDTMDLSDAFSAQRPALYPFDGADHFDNNGLLWLSYVLKSQLISQKIIPWTTPKP
jgi:hypothetical protein